MKRSKGYAEMRTKVNRQKQYELHDAVTLAKEIARAQFDETVDIALCLNVKKSQTVRDTMVLPHQFASEKRILVFARGERAEEARQAGAAYVGDADLIEKIKGGWLDFDVAVATPDMMKDVGRLGQILGRRGLMPNPKTQTVTADVTSAVNDLKKGRVEFRSDKTGIVHLAVGKVSMSVDQIVKNAQTVIDEVIKRRPADTKGVFITSAAISTTMGPWYLADSRRVTCIKQRSTSKKFVLLSY